MAKPQSSVKIKNPFLFLRDLPNPRPFEWYDFIKQRRSWYLLIAAILLAICVVVPVYIDLSEIKSEVNLEKIRPNQIALYFGALVVVAFTRYTYLLNRLWDDSKKLAKYGQIEEANLLWVIHSKSRLIVTYRFWTIHGKEILKETVIDADGKQPLAELAAGDVVPVLFDPRSPRSVSMLWAEIERYVTLTERAKHQLSAQAVQTGQVSP